MVLVTMPCFAGETEVTIEVCGTGRSSTGR